ncbi:MAG: extracellular solute-binding protein [Proteobacteria bacterium]|nr:extracellular solute-binding protein [Pseudomonadota bacterium]
MYERAPIGRRRFLALSGAAAAAGTAALWPRVSVAAAPPAEGITPELIAAATNEGKLNYYTSVDLKVAEQTAKKFEAKFPGIKVKVERSGAERNFQRIAQERASNIFNCDTVNTSDAAHCIIWKREGLLEPVMPEDVAKHYPPEHRDPDGTYASWRVMLSPIAYNTTLVKPEDAPKSFADLLDPKWSGKMVKAHPGYSGTIMTSTQQTARELGWGYFEQLAKQKILQVQSAADPPKKLALGERAVMFDGGDYVVELQIAAGAPLVIVYPTEGTPLITGPSAVMKKAPNPNAARLFHLWSFTPEGQEVAVKVGALRSAHALVKDRPGRKPLSEIKLMREDAAEVERTADDIKAKYAAIFKV